MGSNCSSPCCQSEAADIITARTEGTEKFLFGKDPWLDIAVPTPRVAQTLEPTHEATEDLPVQDRTLKDGDGGNEVRTISSPAPSPADTKKVITLASLCVDGVAVASKLPAVSFSPDLTTSQSLATDDARRQTLPHQRSYSSTSSLSRAASNVSESFSHRVSRGIRGVRSFLQSKSEGSKNGEALADSQYKQLPTANLNSPSDFLWMQEILQSIVRNEAQVFGCSDIAIDKNFAPLFVVAGSCPNYFAGMQAVMYSVAADGEVDFWWVKPMKEAATTLERNTLNRHSKGTHKNDPGRSKPFYKPLADVFAQATVQEGLRFSIDRGADGKRAPRAYIEMQSHIEMQPERMYIYLVWQEDWTNNPFARVKYVKGRILYQREPEANVFYSRQFSIQNGVVYILELEQGPIAAPLPDDQVKLLYDWAPGQKTPTLA